MPKRRHSDDFNDLSRKIKKLKRKLKRARHRKRDSDESSPYNPSEELSVGNLLDSPSHSHSAGGYESLDSVSVPGNEQRESLDEQIITPENPIPTPEIEVQTQSEQAPQETVLDSDALDILGIDLSTTTLYGKDIHNDLATRLEHIATTGLTKELRKELTERYLLPANCVKIGGPSMNPEIKAAVTDVVIKRDKGIEATQKQLGTAIAGLSIVLNNELGKKDKDSNILKQIMDVTRILCDIQHAESVTRRNFSAFSIKKELKDHLLNTKIDQTLFGENLAETLKSAKAVSKSGSDLKTKPQPKSKPSTSFPTTTHLNYRSPAPARKYQGPHRNQENNRPPTTAPGYQPWFNRNLTHVNSSKTSQLPSKQVRRR